MRRCLVCWCAVVLTVAGRASAQSAQPWSVELSEVVSAQDLGVASNVRALGTEAQVRFTPRSPWSFGGGASFASHRGGGESMDVLEAFVEPRYTLDVGSNRFAPYVAGRAALVHENSTLFTTGPQMARFSSGGESIAAGGGLLLRASSRVNVDLGLAFAIRSFADARAGNSTATFGTSHGWVARLGASLGFGSR